MFLRPVFIISTVIIFSALNGWVLINALRHNNAWGSTLSLLAIGGTFYFVHIYQKLLTTPPDELENDGMNPE